MTRGLVIVMALSVTCCRKSDSAGNGKGETKRGMVKKIERGEPSFPKAADWAAVLHLRDLLDPVFPGRGNFDYEGGFPGDIAKSYAALVMGEALLVRSGKQGGFSDRALTSGHWLLDHADENHDGVTGWGVPSSWDAFQDGSVNPLNTEYTISTSLALAALLDWMECDKAAPKERIMAVVGKAMEPYLTGSHNSPGGIPAYSLTASDAKYDCYNPAGHLLGVAQRLSALLRPANPARADALANLADVTVKVLVAERLISPSGNWFWNYSKDEKTANDMPHAGYIIEGLWQYAQHGGRLAGQIEIDKVMGHLRDFRDGAGKWFEWPTFRSDLKVPPQPRTYDWGMGMLIACRLMADRELATDLLNQLQAYRRGDGFFRTRPGDDAKPVINEYQSYVLWGLSAFQAAFGSGETKGGTAISTQRVNSGAARPQWPEVSIQEELRVPWTHFTAGASEAALFVNLMKNETRLALDAGPALPVFPVDELPLKLLPLEGGGYLAWCRHMLTSRLSLLHLAAQGAAWKPVALADPLTSEGLFREARLWGNKCLTIIYSAARSENLLVCQDLVVTDGGVELKTLRSEKLNIDAYLNYQHQPRLFWVESGKQLFLCGGAAVFSMSVDGDTTTARLRKQNIPLDYQIIEAVGSKAGTLALLCKRADTKGWKPEPNIYAIFTGSDLAQMIPVSEDGVPHGLTFEGERPKVLSARTPVELADVMVADWRNGPSSGVMSMGISNEEGEMVWSQSYYLNALVDIIRLSCLHPDQIVFSERIRNDAHLRLTIEMHLLDRQLTEGRGLKCRVFSVNREEAEFAVQAGKMLLLLKRYLFTPNALQLASFPKLNDRTPKLDGLIEDLAVLNLDEPSLPSDLMYLFWPKGCVFPYDGAALPYNHQNCWAGGLLYRSDLTILDAECLTECEDIARLVSYLEGFRDKPSCYDRWDDDDGTAYRWGYWWGNAKTGWPATSGISKNTPEWKGNGDNAALARYRTFDSIAMLEVAKHRPRKGDDVMRDFLFKGVGRNEIEPFLAPFFDGVADAMPMLPRQLAASHARVCSQPDWRNEVWAVWMLATQP